MNTATTWHRRSLRDLCHAIKQNIFQYDTPFWLIKSAVVSIRRESEDHFIIVDVNGFEYNVHKVILAVGSSFIFPNIQGYREAWSRRM